MLRTALFTAITLTASLSLAETKKVKDLPSTKAATEPVTGCGLQELPTKNDRDGTEHFMTYSSKTLAKSSSKLKAKRWPNAGADIKGAWSWCQKPDAFVRVWSACLGTGEEAACMLFAAPVDAKGKLGKVSSVMLDSLPPEIEDIDSSDSPWKVPALKVKFEAGRGSGYIGAYVDKTTVKFTKTEWDE